MIYYEIQRAPDGTPARLAWSSAIQRAGEEHDRAEAERFAKMRDGCTRPMPHLEAWAIKHGLWKPEAKS